MQGSKNRTWAAKSYSATTYWTGGLGFGFNGGGGGGARFVAADAAAPFPWSVGVYDGGGSAWPEGGGGGVFLNTEELEEGVREGGGKREVEPEEDVVDVVAARPRLPWLRLACTIFAVQGSKVGIGIKTTWDTKRTDWYHSFYDIHIFYHIPCICSLVLVDLCDLCTRHVRNIVLGLICKAVHLFQDKVVDIQSFQLWGWVSIEDQGEIHTACRRTSWKVDRWIAWRESWTAVNPFSRHC